MAAEGRPPDPPGAGRAAGRADLLAAPLAAALLAAALGLAGLLRPLDEAAHDQLATRLAPLPGPAEVVLVAIDEPSFAEIGRPWPWPRDLHARLVHALRAAGARAIGFDVVFADPGDPAADAALAAAMGPDVVLAADRETIETPQGRLTMEILPFAALLAAGAVPGRIALPLDPDGAMRRMPPEPDGFARRLLGRDAPLPEGARIAFAGPPGALPRVSYWQALEPARFLPPGHFAGRTVIVGLALRAPAELRQGGQDVFRTPWTARGAGLMPGMEIQANVFETLRAGAALRPAPAWAAPLLGLLLALAAALALRGRAPAPAAAALALLLALLLGLAALALALRLWLPPAAPALALLLAGAGQVARDLARERAARRRIARAFAHYLAPALVQRLARDPAALRLGGERRRITAMFCDLRDFTTLSEALRDDPEALTRLVNRALTPIADAVLAREGTIDKFVGDCVVGIWNAPLDTPGHAGRAVEAALAAIAAIGRLAAEVAAEARAAGRPLPALACGAGINTGDCVVGNMGTERRFAYTAMGDAMNLAARLEGLTKPLAVPLLLGEATAAELPAADCVELDLVVVKGRGAPARIFTHRAVWPGWGPEAAALQAEALARYRARDFAAAAALWDRLAAALPAAARHAAVMAARARAYRAAPPPADWRGEWTAETK